MEEFEHIVQLLTMKLFSFSPYIIFASVQITVHTVAPVPSAAKMPKHS